MLLIMDTKYFVNNQDHRRFTGSDNSDIWNTIGKIQLELCVANGLKPETKFIDIGCGCLRAGVHFVRLLANNYYGIDMHKPLIDAGLEVELPAVGLQSSYDNFDTNQNFDLSKFNVKFQMGIAQSVFTHLPLSKLIQCLNNIHPFFELHGKFFVTMLVDKNADYIHEFDLQHRLRPIVNGQPSQIKKDTYRIYNPDDAYDNSGLKSFVYPSKMISGLPNIIQPQWKMTSLGRWKQHPNIPNLYMFEKVL